jgi:hypothetical protein
MKMGLFVNQIHCEPFHFKLVISASQEEALLIFVIMLVVEIKNLEVVD